MAAADYKSVVEQLYISYFGRPADYFALQNFTAQLNTLGAPTTIAGLDAAVQANTSPALNALVNSFATSPSAQPAPTTELEISQFVSAVYENVLHRQPTLNGAAYWINAIKTGVLTTPNASLAITAAALANTSAQGLLDGALVNATNAVAVAFTDSMDTPAEINAFVGPAAVTAAQSLLLGVTATTTVAAYQATIDAAISGLVDGANVGESKNLTTGLDALVGTSANDTFVALIDDTTGGASIATTLTPLDSITGGDGTDTLSLNILNGAGAAGSATAVGAVPSITLTSVETVNIRTAVDLTADLSTWSGVTNVTLSEVGATHAIDLTVGATADINVVGKAAGAALDLAGGKNVTVTLTDVAAADVITIGSTAAKGVVAVTTTGAASVAAGDVNLSDITVTGGSSINVVQKATSTDAAAATDTTGATITDGDVIIAGNAITTAVSVKQDATVAEVVAVEAVAAVATTQEVTFTAAAADDVVTLDFGTGTGTLAFTAKKALTAVEVATAFASLVEDALQGKATAKNGIYTDAIGGVTDGWTSGAVVVVDADNAKVKFSNADSTAADITAAVVGTVTATAAASVTGVDAVDAVTGVLGVTAGVVDIEDSGTATIKTITVDGYGNGSDIGSDVVATALLNTLSLANADGTASMTVADTAATLALTVEKLGSKVTAAGITTTTKAVLTATAAPTTLNVTSTGANYITLTAAATEILNVSGTGTLDISTNDLAALTTVKVTGSAGLKLNAGVANTVTSVDTTGTTGSVTISIQGDTSTYAGGAGVDTVTVTNPGTAISKAISLGAGNDSLDLSAATPLVPTVVIAGGDGTDTLVLAAADAESLTGSIAFEAKITSFEKLNVKLLGADQTVDLANLDAINYVITNGDGGNALLLDNMLTGATVELKVVGTGSTEVALADDTGTSDIVNLVINTTSGIAPDIAVGTVIANGVETVNITVKDTDANVDATDTVVSLNRVTIAGDAAATITVAGAGDLLLTLDATSTEVILIDASTATGALTVLTLAGDTAATTVKGGAGADLLTAQGAADVLKGGAGADTLAVAGNAASAATLYGDAGIDTFDVSGFTAANAGSAVTIADLAKGETIKFVASAGNADFNSAKVTLISEATFTEYVSEAATQADVASGGDHGIAWFQFNSNTFIVQDVDGDALFTNGTDIIVKITGLVDLSASSFNDATNGSLMYL